LILTKVESVPERIEKRPVPVLGLVRVVNHEEFGFVSEPTYFNDAPLRRRVINESD
jgi:hypothetical protein